MRRDAKVRTGIPRYSYHTTYVETLKVTGGRSASMDGVLTAGAAEQQGNPPAPVQYPSRLRHILGAQHFGSLGSLSFRVLSLGVL